MSYTLDLAAIKARAEAATPGPWTVVGDGASGAFYGGEDCYDVVSGGYAVACGGRSEEGGPEVGACERADAEFIAHARADVPALVADLARLTAAVRAALDVFDAPSAHYSTDPDVRAALDAMRDEERDAAAALRRALDGAG